MTSQKLHYNCGWLFVCLFVCFCLNSILQQTMTFSIAILSFLGRVHRELQERVEFFQHVVRRTLLNLAAASLQ